jgi:hypothetical protein
MASNLKVYLIEIEISGLRLLQNRRKKSCVILWRGRLSDDRQQISAAHASPQRQMQSYHAIGDFTRRRVGPDFNKAPKFRDLRIRYSEPSDTSIKGASMTASFANGVEHYETYARHCLALASQTPDRDARLILREMAAEWLKLAFPGGFDGDAAAAVKPLDGARFDD